MRFTLFIVIICVILETEPRRCLYQPQNLEVITICFYLSAEGMQPISWAIRMNIAVDVARGLSFLHGLDANVIYRDLKAANILLDSVY